MLVALLIPKALTEPSLWPLAIAVFGMAASAATVVAKRPGGLMQFRNGEGWDTRFRNRVRTLIAATAVVTVEIPVFKFLNGFDGWGYHPVYGLLTVTKLAGALLAFLAPLVLFGLCWHADQRAIRLPRITIWRMMVVVAVVAFVVGSAQLMDRHFEAQAGRFQAPRVVP